MIQDIKIKNFLSFKDEVVLSFEATKDTTLEENYVVEVAPGVRLLRFAMVMGANASGKSNLLETVEFLRQWWFDKPEDMDEETNIEPFLLDKATIHEPSELELRFWIDSTKYCYTLKLDCKQVYLERLTIYRSFQPTVVFTRELIEGSTVITFNPAVEKVSDVAMEELQVKCLNNMSIFAARQRVNVKLSVFDDVRDWMRTAIKPIIDPEIKMFDWALEEMRSDEKVKEHILKILRAADFNITDIRSVQSVEYVPEKYVPMLLNSVNMTKEDKERLKNEGTIVDVDYNFVHHVVNERGEEEYPMDVDYQSYGTRRFIGMEAAIYEATKDSLFINIDELEASIHHDLVLFILRQFLKQQSRSQMLVTTHYTPFLNELDHLIRKDSVWFTERNKNGATELYSLSEFKGLNRLSSIQKAYLEGRFGARPDIKETELQV